MKKQVDGASKKKDGKDGKVAISFTKKQQIAPLSSGAAGNGVGFATEAIEIDSPGEESDSPQKEFKIMEDTEHSEMDRKASKRSRLSSITFRRRKKTRRWSAVQREQMEEKNNPFNKRIMAVADGTKSNILMAAITLFSLFGDDIRLGLTSKSADDAFYSAFVVCFVLFSAEFLVFSWAKPGYRWGFYFVLDIIATLSIIPDIGWWWDDISPATSSSSTSNDELTATRMGRLSRVGTRAGRMVRILCMVRLVRIAKLIGYASKQKQGAEEEEEGVGNPSHVGKRMTELTTRRMIILVLVMLLVFPLFDLFMDETVIDYKLHGLASLDALISSGVPDSHIRAHLTRYVTATGLTLLQMDVFNYSGSHDVNAIAVAAGNAPFMSVAEVKSQYRVAEFAFYTNAKCYEGGLEIPGECNTVAYFDIKSDNSISSNINMLKTLVVMFVLCAGVMTFTTDAEKLLIRPIERMVVAIKNFSNTPLAGLVSATDAKAQAEETFETMMLQKVLDKTAGMLRIAFGEAGSDIIRTNLGQEGELDPMIPGKKINAVFGFCDIRQFTDATECLQEEVMVFVNKIGAIVHNVCHQYRGAANKNIGDAFLICWKVSKLAMRGAKTLDAVEPGEHEQLSSTVDNALLSFLKCTVLLEQENSNRHSTLGKYQSYTTIQHRFPEGFRVRMGYGLHIGWAIEGAIGSRYKIDASYLSPHVNISARLEAATKQYGVPLLLSSSFYTFLTPAAQQMCRQLDCVQVKGSEQPIGLYTCDICNTDVTCFDKDPSDIADVPQIAADFTAPDLAQLQEGMPDGFRVNFTSGVKSYLNGDWQNAHDALTQASRLWPTDGPCQTLLNHMAKTGNQAPEGWDGNRSLTEK